MVTEMMTVDSIPVGALSPIKLLAIAAAMTRSTVGSLKIFFEN
jgi:hypothetical protein